MLELVPVKSNIKVPLMFVPDAFPFQIAGLTYPAPPFVFVINKSMAPFPET